MGDRYRRTAETITGSSASAQFRSAVWPRAREARPALPWCPFPPPAAAAAAPGPARPPRGDGDTTPGVALINLPFYDPSRPFRCLDGSATIDFSWVNDDYCDCGDGSDEPDCCDGTDEWDSEAGCENTCRERGRREREARSRLAALAREGFVLRQRLVQEAAEGMRDKQARRGGLQESRKEHGSSAWGTLRAAKEAAERPRTAARGGAPQEMGRAKGGSGGGADEARAAEAFAELDTDGDGRLTGAELQAPLSWTPTDTGAFSETEAEALLGPGVLWILEHSGSGSGRASGSGSTHVAKLSPPKPPLSPPWMRPPPRKKRRRKSQRSRKMMMRGGRS
ncbi:glucosidase 2 subunit beta [Chiroxiphia lanceolata]|uniref:glucosidase 2 subunit beta n=1 Tax=Chiroxiphia lanceolata TaxID=296741 RepID=UPI0013CF0E8E|nr:glucosidase 2 subunit beta [Chiroxiphia lanceolata]